MANEMVVVAIVGKIIAVTAVTILQAADEDLETTSVETSHVALVAMTVAMIRVKHLQKPETALPEELTYKKLQLQHQVEDARENRVRKINALVVNKLKIKAQNFLGLYLLLQELFTATKVKLSVQDCWQSHQMQKPKSVQHPQVQYPC